MTPRFQQAIDKTRALRFPCEVDVRHRSFDRAPFYLRKMADYRDLDRQDILILSALGEDPRMSASELGLRVHLSRTAVSRRLQAIRESGLLQDSPQVVRYESIGLKTRAFVELFARDKNVDFIMEALLERAEVLKVSVVASKSLLLIEVVSFDLEHLSQFIKWLQKFGDTETKIAFFSENSKMTLKDRLDRLKKEPNRQLHSVSPS